MPSEKMTFEQRLATRSRARDRISVQREGRGQQQDMVKICFSAQPSNALGLRDLHLTFCTRQADEGRERARGSWRGFLGASSGSAGVHHYCHHPELGPTSRQGMLRDVAYLCAPEAKQVSSQHCLCHIGTLHNPGTILRAVE